MLKFVFLQELTYICSNEKKTRRMTKEEIIERFGDKEPSAHWVDMGVINELSTHCGLSLEIEKITMSYYYDVSIESLVASGISREGIEGLYEGGWGLSKDKEHLMIYIP